ncbi:uncharacterized protein Dana_GF20076 [Drosophila ananassae]|uniref:Chitin-binding type-2 domain-containing protein n=1 Tax=Drosophila ananassae TaxID=7217 RepID=B3M5Y3_DROAN|nr:uncharacterized protein LOC6502799 [Drosophila ananassae]EDV39673.2 uncharacterized protein Dana_GF20076 [Drosophila ananassae]
MLRRLLILGVLLVAQVGFSQANCNICSSATKKACVSKTQYQNCTTDDRPTGPIYTCPNNTYCSVTAAVCSATTAEIACAECNQCGDYFACTGTSSFALCFQGSVIPNATYSCNPGQVCSKSLTTICGDSATGTVPSCSYYDSAAEVGNFCLTKASAGRFPYPNDPSCSRYINCFYKGSAWNGTVWNCPTAKPYFSSTSLICTSTKPTNCT